MTTQDHRRANWQPDMFSDVSLTPQGATLVMLLDAGEKQPIEAEKLREQWPLRTLGLGRHPNSNYGAEKRARSGVARQIL